jgi:predicted GIY-YIG superfamily endonuclease
MFSLDVVALYTNVPIQWTIDKLTDHLHNNDIEFELPKETIIKLITLCLSQTFFTFENQSYKQLTGLAMGSPISAIIANIFMEFFEKTYIINDINFSCWCRYVDDIFAITRNDIDLHNILNQLNNKLDCIKFTIEIENDNKINYLDTTIIKDNNNRPTFKIFRKPTSIYNYIHWYSSHSVKIKKSTLTTFFLRALKIVSPQFLKEETEIIKNIFKKLCYPNFIIYQAINIANSIYYKNNGKNKNMDKPTLILPYNPPKLTSKLISPKINITTQYNNTIGNLTMHTKFQNLNPPVIYKIECPSCNLPYIGETIDFDRRMQQHNRDLRMDNINSALVQHRNRTNHNFLPLIHNKIKETNDHQKRKIIESYYIKNTINLNLKGGEYFMDPLTLNILNYHKLFPPLN